MHHINQTVMKCMWDSDFEEGYYTYDKKQKPNYMVGKADPIKENHPTLQAFPTNSMCNCVAGMMQEGMKTKKITPSGPLDVEVPGSHF